MSNKKKLLTVQNQLKEQGIILNNYIKNLKFNLPDQTNPKVQNYINAMTDYDVQQCCSRYQWEGLPDGLTSWLLELMLYHKTTLAGKIVGGILYILPYTIVDGPNVYGVPSRIQTVTYNGVNIGDESIHGDPLPVNVYGVPAENPTAVILYDRIPTYSQSGAGLPRSILDRQLIELQADILGRIEQNLETACFKLVFECDNEKQANQLDQDISKNLRVGKSYIIRIKDSIQGKEGTPYQTGVQLETQTLVECWQSINSIRTGLSGIRNGGAFEKKERAVQAELSSDSIQSDIVLNNGLEMRRLFLKQMILAYPDYIDKLSKIKVSICQALEDAQEREKVPTVEEEEARDNASYIQI